MGKTDKLFSQEINEIYENEYICIFHVFDCCSLR